MRRLRRRRRRLNAAPWLGSGLGYRPQFRAELFENRARIDFLEIIADHYFDAPPEKLAELDLLAAHFPLVPHGLDLSLGGAEGLDAAYVEKLARLVERINPPWFSEHLFSRGAAAFRSAISPPCPTPSPPSTRRRATSTCWASG